LSPNITKSGSGIDLGKRGVEVDMGRKSAPSVTSGGIGVTREITNIGGLSVSGGVSVDISPLDFNVGYDTNENAISIAAGAEIPGGLLGASGGVTIDLDTGEVSGVSVGVEGLGVGVNVSASKDGGVGVGLSLQIPFTPIEIELGFGFPPKGDKEPTTTPADETNWEKPILPPGRPGVNCTVLSVIDINWQFTSTVDPESSFSFISTGGGSYNPNTNFYMTTRTIFNKSGTKPPEITKLSGQGFATNWRQGDLFDVYIGDGGFSGYAGQEAAIYKILDLGYSHYTISNEVGTETKTVTTKIIYSSCSVGATPSPSPSPSSKQTTPFPNPPPTKRNMDECCRDTTKLLREIHKRLGIDKFPGKLPATIIQEIPKEGEQPEEPAQVPIEDYVDLLDWQFRRDDERWGQWVVQIDVKDSDLTKKGNQGKQIKFPNLAESIAELEGQMLSVMANVDALVAITTKNLVESGMARQESIKSYLAAKAIIKYMAFKSTEIDIPVPLTFTPGAETISVLIQESEGHIKGTDYVEKETFRDICLDLLQAAAIIRAVHWQKIDSKGDTKTQLLNLLKGTVDLAGLISNPKKQNDGEKEFDPEQNFEDFIDSVEDGFRNTTGITDIQNPYGRTPDRRPRIREIGDNLSQAGGDK
jgi:hypothetical protein